MKVVKTLDTALEKFSIFLLVVSVLAMLFFSSGSIFLRWFHINLPWIDPFIRHLVFFSAFLGGVVATGRGTHIGIDLVGKIIESKGWHGVAVFIKRFIMVSSFFVLLWLIQAGWEFTKVEMEFAKIEFWGISSGYLVMMIPVGLSLIALRFFFVFLLSFSKDPHALVQGEVP